MKHIIQMATIAALLSCQWLSAQNTVGLISYKSWASYDGYNLFYPHNQSTVFLINNCGELVHSWEDEDGIVPGNTAYLTEDGYLYKTKRPASIINDPIWAGGGGAIIEVRDWDNNLIADFEMNDSLYRLHHDIAVMPNGNVLAIAWELKTTEEVLAAGRDTATLTQNILWPDWILEVDPFNDSIVWEWHSWDHLVQDFDSTKNNYGVVGDHPELIDLNYGRPDGHPDWHHGNAIDYNPELDQVMISIPYFDELWVIDHSTTTEEAAGHTGGLSNKGGDLIYRWGNPLAYDRGDESDQKLFFQHDTHWIDDFISPSHPYYGKIGVFNNRFATDYSAGHVISPVFDMYDWSYLMDNGTYLPETYDIIITHPDTTPLHSTGLSSIQFLQNGNILFINGRTGYSFELTPDNEIVWEYITPLIAGQPATQGDILSINNNLTFRMKRFPVDFPAFDGKDLSPKGWIELEPNTNYCAELTSVDNPKIDFKYSVYPNPVSDFLNIESSDSGPFTVEVYDAEGRWIESHQSASSALTIDARQMNNGIYFIQITGGENIFTRPVVILH